MRCWAEALIIWRRFALPSHVPLGICWERRNGRHRAEVPLDKLIEFLNAERIVIRDR